MKVVAKPVRMIAAFDEKGAPEPIRFKIEEYGFPVVVKVGKVIGKETIRPSGMEAIVFRCQSEMCGSIKHYELIFRVKPHQWELYRI